MGVVKRCSSRLYFLTAPTRLQTKAGEELKALLVTAEVKSSLARVITGIDSQLQL